MRSNVYDDASNFSILNILKKINTPFLWIEFNCPKAAESPRRNSLLLTTKPHWNT